MTKEFGWFSRVSATDINNAIRDLESYYLPIYRFKIQATTQYRGELKQEKKVITGDNSSKYIFQKFPGDKLSNLSAHFDTAFKTKAAT